MTDATRCARCGGPAPDPAFGCPRCLMRLALTKPSPPDDAPFVPPPDLEPIGEIGRGGMGVVFKARQKSLDRLVAVKVLGPRLADNPEFDERFAREAKALARVSHPNVVAVHEVGQSGGARFIVMEFVEGVSLRERLRDGPLPQADAVRLLLQLCEAVTAAHGCGVVHRDLKPENVLIDAAGHAKVVDFGLAKLGDKDALTSATGRMGTARYMAPEQWDNAAGADHRADIYSLGVILYEMLTGDVPGPQSRPASARTGIDRRFDAVIARSLQPAPAERYQSAHDLGAAVGRIAASPGRPGRAALLLFLGATASAIWFVARPAVAPTSPPGPTELLTSAEWEWSPPENLGPGVNTRHGEGQPCVSGDGLTLIFWSDRPGGSGNRDLWECRRPSVREPFAGPVNLGAVNARRHDESPSLSADGLTLVFLSNRGVTPDTDIWMTTRPAPGAAWGAPLNLGPGVNSAEHEFRPWLWPDGRTLTFSSMRAPRDGVWVTRRRSAAESFGPAEPFGRDSHARSLSGPSVSADGGTLLVGRFDRSFRGDLLWLGRVGPADDPFRELFSFGPAVNSASVDTDPAPSPDGREVFFQSDRPGGAGGFDIWVTRRVPRGGRP